MRARCRDTCDKVVQWHWQRSVTSRRDPKKKTALCVGSLDTLPRIAGRRRQHNVDSGCTNHIVTNIDEFLDFVPIQSVVRNPNGEASRVVGRGCVRIIITLKRRGIPMRTQKCSVCAGVFFKPPISLKMHGVGT